MALEEEIGVLLRTRGWKLATAESCTGGLIGHRLTNVAGSSDYYLGGVIAYANEVKTGVLGVRAETLADFGAVSQVTVIEMAWGARTRLGGEVGLAVSGIAGPGGGTPEKPVGLTWIGLSAEGFERAWMHTWEGDRLAVKEQTAEQALMYLVEFLSGTADGG